MMGIIKEGILARQKKMIIEVRDLPDGEKIYVTKKKNRYKIVHPAINEDGSWNWMNFLFGGKKNLFKLIGYIGLAILIYLAMNELIANYKFIAENPCDFCSLEINCNKGFDKLMNLKPN